MYKRLLLALGLFSATHIAHAQKAKEYKQFDEIEFKLTTGQDQVTAYSELADTTHKPSYQVARNRTVDVVGEYSPRWAVIDHNGYTYFVRQKDLAGLASGQTVKQVAAIINAPLPLDPSSRLIDFTKVVQVPGANKDELYARGKVWFANTFKSAQNVIQADDKSAGILIGKGWQTAYVPNVFGSPIAVKLWYTVKLAFKEGRYKYDITDFKFEYPITKYNLSPTQIAAESITSQAKKDGTPTKPAQAHARSLSQEARSTGLDLELSMNKPAVGTDF